VICGTCLHNVDYSDTNYSDSPTVFYAFHVLLPLLVAPQQPFHCSTLRCVFRYSRRELKIEKRRGVALDVDQVPYGYKASVAVLGCMKPRVFDVTRVTTYDTRADPLKTYWSVVCVCVCSCMNERE
jgi:hypothetical protein